ncbi:MAG: polymer-forming cytoskeletal protein [Thermodesulfobacteriota bacterium]|nr:polymer-forming cytoskeletal protein [Thermodesulfobacteriota bacterium]
MMKDKKAGLSIIDKGCKVKGTAHVEGKLIVIGTLEGTLEGDTVVTAQGSHVMADVKVREMVIGGKFEGDVTAYENVRLLKTGEFTGKVFCRNIDVEPGGQLNGSVKILEADDETLRSDTKGSG